MRILLSLTVALTLVSCRKTPVRTNEVVAVPAQKVPLNPADPAWDHAPEHLAKLIPQDLVEPRLLKPSTAEVLVRALTNSSEIAFRLQWIDATPSDLPGAGRFVDACAVQIPKKAGPTAPAPQMGELGRPVEVTFWRADWQASVNGRKDTIQELYPNASVDHYPFEAKPLAPGSQEQKDFSTRYSPATGAGNRRGGPRPTPVEDMLAEGPGTLVPAASTTSRGQGVRTPTGWSVVFSRRAPEGLAPRQRTAIAFAVWEGGSQETGARKMRTGWIPLLMQEAK